MPSRIPPYIAWPAFIVLLFAFGALSTLTMVWIARSDGGAQVIDDYYDKAVTWDQTAARRDASRSLGWHMGARLTRGAGPSSREVTVRIETREGNPVSGLEGTVRLYRPEVAGWLAEFDLVEDPDEPGSYRHEMPFGRSGLWDVEVDASRDSLRFWEMVRAEMR